MTARMVCAWCLCWLAWAANARESTPDPLAGTERQPGFVDVYRDPVAGRVLIGVHELDTPFLLVTALPGGLGSNDVGLDRGQSGMRTLARFRRVGDRLLLIADNARYGALSADADEVAAATDAFAPAVLWAGKLIERPVHKGQRERAAQPLWLVDFASFLTADRHGITAALKASGQGDYQVDAERSAVLAEAARSFPDNTELEALLTLSGPGEGEFVKQVAADPRALSLRQHISLVRLPPPGFEPRPYHPASGAFSIASVDFAQPLSASLQRRLQPRFRLQKDANGQVLKPIVFYLDRGTPEPVRSALLEGANWWSTAFAEAGFPGGFRAELLPAGADPMDIRYNVITWTHRATRGWSYGDAIVDPRTGEILKGVVNLGSQRVRQDILIAEALLAPYGQTDAAALADQALQMALARLRQLAAHEVGHSLGFAHNFAASLQGNGSVMDYPHPLITLAADGTLALTGAYGVGVGAWDRFLVQHAYGAWDADGLAALRTRILAAGYRYVSDADARAPGDAHPDGALWDLQGADPIAGFERLLAARRHALAHFGVGVLPPDRQLGELEARLVPIYLLHRYQTEALARLLGGARYRYGLAGDTPAGATPVDAATQRAALQQLMRTLSPAELSLPEAVLAQLTPPSADSMRDREYFGTRATPLFDPLGAADAAAALTLQFLLAPPRLQRLALQHAADPALPGIEALMNALLEASWRAPTPADPRLAQVQRSVNWVVLEALLASVDAGTLHPTVDADLRAQLRQFADWAAREPGQVDRAAAADRVRRYLNDPASVKLRPLPVVPPGAPI